MKFTKVDEISQWNQDQDQHQDQNQDESIQADPSNNHRQNRLIKRVPSAILGKSKTNPIQKSIFIEYDLNGKISTTYNHKEVNDVLLLDFTIGDIVGDTFVAFELSIAIGMLEQHE